MPVGPAALIPELSAHPHAERLGAVARDRARRAAHARDTEFGATPSELDADLGLELDAAATPHGNLLEVLTRGAQSSSEYALVAAWVALGVRADFPSSPEVESERARELSFIAAHTRVNPLPALDATLGAAAGAFWSALAQVAKESDLATAAVIAAALATSTHDAAKPALDSLLGARPDPLLSAVLGPARAHGDARLSGELGPTPRGPLATTLLALSGLLFVLRGARLIGRLALAYKKPAAVRLTERGLELEHRVEILGRVLRRAETVVPMENLARVTREVRFSRLGLSLGLLALALGSYLGMGLLVDGARVPGSSPPLIGMGLLIIALGVAIDFGLSLFDSEARGKCRLVIVPRKGTALCIARVESGRADAMLARVAARGDAA